MVVRAGVELSIEESLKTPGKYFLTMVIGQLDICFSIANPGTADSLCQFAEAYHAQKKHKEIKLGDLAGLPVYLVKDDEYANRAPSSALRLEMETQLS